MFNLFLEASLFIQLSLLELKKFFFQRLRVVLGLKVNGVNRAKFFLQIANFVRIMHHLLIQINVLGNKLQKHLCEVLLEISLFYDSLLDRQHSLPYVTLMALITLRNKGTLVSLTLRLFEVFQEVVTFLSLTH